jgi:hypothetical protein
MMWMVGLTQLVLLTTRGRTILGASLKRSGECFERNSRCDGVVGGLICTGEMFMSVGEAQLENPSVNV